MELHKSSYPELMLRKLSGVSKKRILCFCLIFVFCFTCYSVTNTRFMLINSPAIIADQLNCFCSVNKRSVPRTTHNNNNNSTCSDWATVRGPHQQVLSYSIYGHDKNYFDGIALNAALIPELYPGWVMRVYYHFTSEEADFSDMLCPIWCEYPHLDLCPVEHLPWPLLNQTNFSPPMWRYLVLGDPLVDRFVSRDVDSLISARETAAVDEWLESGKTFHFMHDHFQHQYMPILAGMWGSLNTNLTLTRRLREEFLLQGEGSFNRKQDQISLAAIVFPVADRTEDYVNHDSYSCQLSGVKKFQPWPTRRNEDGDFVGMPDLRTAEFNSTSNFLPCPEQCRPPQHQDWTFC